MTFDKEMKQFIEDMKKSPQFGHLFNRIHVGHKMIIFRKDDERISMEWRPIHLDKRDKRKGARFINRGKGAWKIFENPYKKSSSKNNLIFHYHGHGCSCCSTSNWTPKQNGNPYYNRARVDSKGLVFKLK
jgi:hypothetical protein